MKGRLAYAVEISVPLQKVLNQQPGAHGLAECLDLPVTSCDSQSSYVSIMGFNYFVFVWFQRERRREGVGMHMHVEGLDGERILSRLRTGAGCGAPSHHPRSSPEPKSRVWHFRD